MLRMACVAEGQQVAKSFTIRWNGGLWFGGCVRRGPDIVDAMACESGWGQREVDRWYRGLSKDSVGTTEQSARHTMIFKYETYMNTKPKEQASVLGFF